MPWFRIDDTFPHHAKVIAAGNAAIGLWARAGAWSMQQLTDGFIPDHVIASLGTRTEARRLVTVGLWVSEDGGYRFHQWAPRQPSRDQVLAEREAAAERQQRARERAKEVRESRRDNTEPVTDASRRDSRSDKGVSHGPPDPTRPIEQQTPSVVGATTADAVAPKRRSKPAQTRPDDFRPSQVHLDLATELGVDLHAEWPKFTDHHDAKGSTFKDWDAALRTWIRNAAQYASRAPRPRADREALYNRQMADAIELERQMGLRP